MVIEPMSYSQFASAAYHLQHHHYQQQQQQQQHCAAVSSTSQLLATVGSFLPQHLTTTPTVSDGPLRSTLSDPHYNYYPAQSFLREASQPSIVDVISSSTTANGCDIRQPSREVAASTMYGTTAAASSLLSYPAARVAALTAATDYSSYSAVAAATGQPYVPFDSSAFYSPLSSDTGDTWRTLSQTTACGGWPYDGGMSSYPYGPSYGGLDVRRKNATRESTSTLKAWLYEHIKNPYPTKGEKIMLAIITKMTLTQVSTWFANARRRLKKENKMQWSPRNRTDNDDDDKSSSDENDDYNDNDNKCHDNGTSSSRQLSKDDEEDIIVDNPVNDDLLHSGHEKTTTQTGLSSGLHPRHLSSCSRVHHQSGHSLHTASIPDSATGITRLHPTPSVGIQRPTGRCAELGTNNGAGTGSIALPPPAGLSSTRCSILSSAAGFMSTCGPASSYYYRPPMPAAMGSASIGSSAYFQPNHSNSVSGMGMPSVEDDDDDNDIDEPIASSEEEENKPRIWSIADVATSCRPLQQRGGAVGLTSVGGSAGHNGFLHPWSNGSASFNYAHYQSAVSQSACVAAATSGFYTSYCQQQRPVATPVARQQHLQPAVPVGMTTVHQQTQVGTGESARCSQLLHSGPASQFANLTPPNTFEITSNDGLTGQSAQCIPSAVGIFPPMTSSRSEVEPYVNLTSSINMADSQTAFKPVVKRL